MSTERTLIEPAQIREGDTIRYEANVGGPGHYAREWVAQDHGDDRCEGDGAYYLLERPEPVERVLDFVPDVETLGWLTVAERDEPVLGSWRRHEWQNALGLRVTALQPERDYLPDSVIDFQEAVAVPKAALAALALAHPPQWVAGRPNLLEPVDHFLRVARGDR